MIPNTRPQNRQNMKTMKENKNYLAGLNVYKGKITYKGVSEAFNLDYTPAETAISD